MQKQFLCWPTVCGACHFVGHPPVSTFSALIGGNTTVTRLPGIHAPRVPLPEPNLICWVFESPRMMLWWWSSISVKSKTVSEVWIFRLLLFNFMLPEVLGKPTTNQEATITEFLLTTLLSSIVSESHCSLGSNWCGSNMRLWTYHRFIISVLRNVICSSSIPGYETWVEGFVWVRKLRPDMLNEITYFRRKWLSLMPSTSIPVGILPKIQSVPGCISTYSHHHGPGPGF